MFSKGQLNKKRSVDDTGHESLTLDSAVALALEVRDSTGATPCRMLGSIKFNGWTKPWASTQAILVQAGLHYLFTFGCDDVVQLVVAWGWNAALNTWERLGLEIPAPGQAGLAGSLLLVPPRTGEIYFSLRFRDGDANGEVALFQLPG